jgi:hypothetical protein
LYFSITLSKFVFEVSTHVIYHVLENWNPISDYYLMLSWIEN